LMLWTAQSGPPFERIWFRPIGYDVWHFRTEYRSDLRRWIRKWSIDQWPAMWDAFCGRLDVFLLIDVYRISRR
jgi:hypothetical protein